MPGLAVVRSHVSQPHASGITRGPETEMGGVSKLHERITGSVCLSLLMNHSGPFQWYS